MQESVKQWIKFIPESGPEYECRRIDSFSIQWVNLSHETFLALTEDVKDNSQYWDYQVMDLLLSRGLSPNQEKNQFLCLGIALDILRITSSDFRDLLKPAKFGIGFPKPIAWSNTQPELDKIEERMRELDSASYSDTGKNNLKTGNDTKDDSNLNPLDYYSLLFLKRPEISEDQYRLAMIQLINTSNTLLSFKEQPLITLYRSGENLLTV